MYTRSKLNVILSMLNTTIRFFKRRHSRFVTERETSRPGGSVIAQHPEPKDHFLIHILARSLSEERTFVWFVRFRVAAHASQRPSPTCYTQSGPKKLSQSPHPRRVSCLRSARDHGQPGHGSDPNDPKST